MLAVATKSIFRSPYRCSGGLVGTEKFRRYTYRQPKRKNSNSPLAFWSQKSPKWLPNGTQDAASNLHFTCVFTVFSQLRDFAKHVDTEATPRRQKSRKRRAKQAEAPPFWVQRGGVRGGVNPSLGGRFVFAAPKPLVAQRAGGT